MDAFIRVPFCYIADGHHRAASAAKTGIAKRNANLGHTGEEEYNWFQAVLFLWNPKMRPIQILLRQMVVELSAQSLNRGGVALTETAEGLTPRNTRSAMVMITIIPILSIYPFLQKYFAKGIMIGSIKG